MRTNSNIESAFIKTDGLAFFPPDEFLTSLAAATDSVLTRNAAGDWSHNMIASKTNIYAIPLAGLLQRLGLIPDLQEQFGTAAGVAGPSGVANTGAPIAVDGRPPFTGATQLTPVTSKAAKGIRLDDVTVHYLVSTNTLTTFTARIDKVVMPATGAAATPTVTPLVASGNNGLILTSSANMYNIKIPVNSAVMTVDDFAYLIVELVPTTPAASTFKLYGVTAHISFNLL